MIIQISTINQLDKTKSFNKNKVRLESCYDALVDFLLLNYDDMTPGDALNRPSQDGGLLFRRLLKFHTRLVKLCLFMTTTRQTHKDSYITINDHSLHK